jgi:hypothetical protein
MSGTGVAVGETVVPRLMEQLKVRLTMSANNSQRRDRLVCILPPCELDLAGVPYNPLKLV